MRASTPGRSIAMKREVVLALERGQRRHRHRRAARLRDAPRRHAHRRRRPPRSRTAAIRSATTAVAVGIEPGALAVVHRRAERGAARRRSR